MQKLLRVSLSLLVFLAACKAQNAAPPADSTASGASAGTLVTDLLADVGTVETKLVDLASAIPEGKYNWHPDSARTVKRVLLHVAADTYVLPAMIGFAPDPSSGLTSDYTTGVAFEGRDIPKDSVIAELKKSFAFVKQSLQSATAASMTVRCVTAKRKVWCRFMLPSSYRRSASRQEMRSPTYSMMCSPARIRLVAKPPFPCMPVRPI